MEGPAKENYTYGLITAEKRSGTTGGFLTEGDIIDTPVMELLLLYVQRKRHSRASLWTSVLHLWTH